MNYTIKKDNISLTVSTLGAEPQSLIYNNIEYIWSGKEWPRRAPLLFPMIGPTKDSKIKANGKLYDMPNNGFARDTEFKLQEEGKDCLTFVLEDSSDIREKYYPYGFTLTVTYHLLSDGYNAKATIKAKDDLYYTFGWHPAFSLSMNKGTTVDDYFVEFEKSERLDSKKPVDGVFEYKKDFVTSNTIKLNRDMFTLGAEIMDNVKSKSVKLYSDKGDHGVNITLGNLTTLTLWTSYGEKDGFLCVEPMHSFGDKTRVQDLEEMKETLLLKQNDSVEYENTFTFF